MKKLTLLISFLGTLLIASAYLGLLAPLYEFDYLELIFNVFLFFPLIFIFSLITHFAPERVFTAWWKFARIAIPIIFLLSLAINLELHHNPQGEWQDMYDVPALILLYSIFTLGSAWQIIKAWRRG